MTLNQKVIYFLRATLILDTISRDNHIYKLQTLQIIEPNKALVIMEEDTDRINIQFYYRYIDHDEKWKKEEIVLDELSSDYIIMSVSELQMLRELGKVTLNSLDYGIHDMEYIIESDGEKIMVINLKFLNTQKWKSGRTSPPEVQKLDLWKSKNQTTRGIKCGSQDVQNLSTNYNNTNYNSSINLINQSKEERLKVDSENDKMNTANAYMQIIRDNIEYDHFMQYADWGEKEIIEELYQIICDIVCVKRASVRIGKEEYPYELVKSKFLKLTSSHIQYVIECMNKTTTKVTNIRAYLITALYNAPITLMLFSFK